MSSRRVILLSYLDSYASILVAFAVTIVISRVLTPAEVGVFSVAAVLVGFVSPFRDFGATRYLVRIPTIDDTVLRTVRSIQFSLGLVLALLISAAATFVADFYGDARIRLVLWILAANSLILPFGALATALLSREMKVVELAVCRLSGTLIGAATTVTLALQGAGPVSLAWGALAGTITSAIAARLLRTVDLDWRPGFKGARDVFGFGGAMTLTQLLGMVYQNIGELSLARLQGLTQSGLYGRAQSFVQMLERLLMEGTYSIGLPIFSKILRQGGQLGPTYVHTMTLLSPVGWSVFGIAAVLADPLILLLYGPQWEAAGSIARSLCLVWIVITPSLALQLALVALGRTTLVVRMMATYTAAQVLVVVLAATQSVEAVCIGVVAVAACTSIDMLRLTRRELQVPALVIGRTLLRSLPVPLAALTPAAVIMYFTAGQSGVALWQVLGSSLLALLAGAAMAHVLKHPLLIEVMRFVNRKKFSAG
jgi:O-antigen/teichoic acid export membrane protein